VHEDVETAGQGGDGEVPEHRAAGKGHPRTTDRPVRGFPWIARMTMTVRACVRAADFEDESP
jgi:hypothetical protein